jgi:hypothetical protein
MFDFSEKETKWIIDVSDYFKKKMAALDVFKSQILWVIPIRFLVLLKGVFFGKRHSFKFAEYFYSE